jgi:hypothetical protein
LRSLPEAWGFGGLVAPVVDADLVAVVMADLRGQRVAQVRIRPNPLHRSAWATGSPSGLNVPRRGHVLSLDGDADHIWAHQFTSSCRRAIRSAEKAGLVVEEDAGGRLVPLFHSLLSQSVERWAGQQHEPAALARWRARRRDPETKFRSWADALGSGCRVLVARRGQDVLAGMVVLQGHNAHMTRGAMDRQLMGSDRANELLMWHAIRGAVDAGCHHFHMGESGSSVSLARYKEKYGARPYDYAEHGFERIPLTRIDRAVRSLVKRAVRFREP